MSDGAFVFDRLQCHSASTTDKIGLGFSQACETPGRTNGSCVSTHPGQPCSCRARRLNNTLNRVLHPKQSGLMLCQQHVDISDGTYVNPPTFIRSNIYDRCAVGAGGCL